MKYGNSAINIFYLKNDVSIIVFVNDIVSSKFCINFPCTLHNTEWPLNK